MSLALLLALLLLASTPAPAWSASAPSAPSRPGQDGADGPCPARCDPASEYCDRFQSSCRPCADLCRQDFSACEQSCETYLKGKVFGSDGDDARLATRDDLRTLQVMLALVAGLTALTLVLTVALVVLKVRGRKRKEKEVKLKMVCFKCYISCSIFHIYIYFLKVLPMDHFPSPPRPRSSTPNSNHHNGSSYLDRQIPSPPPSSAVMPNGCEMRHHIAYL